MPGNFLQQFCIGLLMVTYLFSCRAQTKLAVPENDSDTQSLFSKNKEWQIKLRSGKTINTKNYSLEASYESIIVDFIKSDQDLYTKPESNSQVVAGVAAGLNVAEALAIFHYTRGGYGDYTKYLSGEPEISYGSGKLLEKQVEAFFLATISAKNKLPTKRNAKLYFGANLPLEVFLPLLKKGMTYSQRNFTSTSMEKSVAELFAGITFPQNRPGNGCFVFTIEDSSTGVDITPFSEFNESEFLFSPNQPFLVSDFSEGKVLKIDNIEYCRTFEVTLKEKN